MRVMKGARGPNSNKDLLYFDWLANAILDEIESFLNFWRKKSSESFQFFNLELEVTLCEVQDM